ncbi:hypothetical protein TNCV_5060601 [Trichonephila clavipes]|nr:hypothetical protein TNCV_5060601 [Trichonephila clavipes]
MAVNDRTASSRQFTARWFTATGVLMSASSNIVDVFCTVDCVQGCLYTGSPSGQSIDGAVCNWLMCTWQSDWCKVVFSGESRFNLWDHDGRSRVRHYAG